MKTFIDKIKARLWDTEFYKGFAVPAKEIRLCRPALESTEKYFNSAIGEARRLVELCDCKRQSRILDVGCGHGRLALGLLQVCPEVQYLGLDILKKNLHWCEKHFAAYSQLQFLHLDLHNERYNAGSSVINESFHFPLRDATWDIVYLFSVFSHMQEAEMKIYLREFRRLLSPGGYLIFTTFVEENVPTFSVNPENYIFEKTVGPLHVVRYEKSHLLGLVEAAGFQIKNFSHQTEIDKQSCITAVVP
jgi:SAM-dependent methyltransferase